MVDLQFSSNADFVGETADIGIGEWGFYRSGADTIVPYGIMHQLDGVTLVALSVKLEDYGGAITTGDVLFV